MRTACTRLEIVVIKKNRLMINVRPDVYGRDKEGRSINAKVSCRKNGMEDKAILLR
jgi:hypothetical protein